jgi:dimeric dUTPase (all-alpha-NTP-PPase superfamily)
MEVEVAKVFMQKIIDINNKTTNFNQSGITSDNFTLNIPNFRINGSSNITEDKQHLVVFINNIKYKIPLLLADTLPEMHNNDIILKYKLDNRNQQSSDNYTLLIGQDIITYIGSSANWFQNTVVSYVNVNQTKYMKLANFDYQGWEFPKLNFNKPNTNILEGKIHLGIWTDKSINVYLTFVNTNIKSNDGKPTEYRTKIVTNNGTWTNVEVNLADFTLYKGNNTPSKSTVFAEINQFVISTDEGYQDNVYIQYLALQRQISNINEPISNILPEMHGNDIILKYKLDSLELQSSDMYTLLIAQENTPYIGSISKWGQNTVVSYVNLNQTKYMKLANFDYQGWEFPALNFNKPNTDILEGKIHIGIWTDISTYVYLTFVNTSVLSNDNKPTEYKTTIITNNATWENVEINLADFVFYKGNNTSSKSTVFGKINQFVISTDEGYQGNVYIQYLALQRQISNTTEPISNISLEMHGNDIINKYKLDNRDRQSSDMYTLLIGQYNIPYMGNRGSWGQNTVVSYVNVNQTKYMKLANFNYQGWEFPKLNFNKPNTNILEGKIHIGILTDKSINIYLTFVNTNIILNNGIGTEYRTKIITNNATWKNVEINLTDFEFNQGNNTPSKSTVFSEINQFYISTEEGNKEDVYIQYLALQRQII